MRRYSIQLAAIILVAVVVVIAIMPAQKTGIIDDSVMKFIKAFGIAIQGLIFGAFAGGKDE